VTSLSPAYRSAEAGKVPPPSGGKEIRLRRRHIASSFASVRSGGRALHGFVLRFTKIERRNVLTAKPPAKAAMQHELVSVRESGRQRCHTVFAADLNATCSENLQKFAGLHGIAPAAQCFLYRIARYLHCASGAVRPGHPALRGRRRLSVGRRNDARQGFGALNEFHKRITLCINLSKAALGFVGCGAVVHLGITHILRFSWHVPQCHKRHNKIVVDQNGVGT